MKEHGLCVKSCDGDFRLDKVNAYNTTEKMPKSDVVIVGLKTTNQSMLKTEVNPESWTQLKGSHEAQIKFGRETCSD